jgi:hypothetical protein
LPSGHTPDSQEKTPASSSQKISQLDLWQLLPGASTITIDLQDQQFLTGAPHNDKKKEESQIQEYVWGTNHDQNPAFRHRNQAGRRKKGQKIQTRSMQKIVVHNMEYLQR